MSHTCIYCIYCGWTYSPGHSCGKHISTITTSPAVTDTKPQGEARECWVRFEGSGIGLHAINLANITEYPDEPTDEPGWVQMREIMPGKQDDPLRDSFESMLNEVYAQREELVKAFIAKHGIGPDEAMIVEKETDTGKIWYIERRPQPSNKLLEAAKDLITWFKANPRSKVGGTMRLVKALAEAIDVKEKKEGKA